MKDSFKKSDFEFKQTIYIAVIIRSFDNFSLLVSILFYSLMIAYLISKKHIVS